MGVSSFTPYVAPLPSGVKSIQRGTIDLTNLNVTASVTIAAVNPSKAEVRFLGCTCSGDSFVRMARVALANATTVTANRVQGESLETTTVSFEVTEWY